MKHSKTKTLVFDYPELGFELICLDQYMFIGDLVGNLPIEPQDVKFGKHLLVSGKSNIIQIGDERGSAVWNMLRLLNGYSLLYLGTLQGDKCQMLIFRPLVNNQPIDYQRNLFGDIGDMPYKNLYVAFNKLSDKELHITTRNHAGRVFRPTVIYA